MSKYQSPCIQVKRWNRDNKSWAKQDAIFFKSYRYKKKCRKDVKATSGLMEAQKSTRAYREKIIPTP